MLAILLASSAFGWRSALYPSGWTPGSTDAEGRGLPDFSYAGYHRGEDPLPTRSSTSPRRQGWFDS